MLSHSFTVSRYDQLFENNSSRIDCSAAWLAPLACVHTPSKSRRVNEITVLATAAAEFSGWMWMCFSPCAFVKIREMQIWGVGRVRHSCTHFFDTRERWERNECIVLVGEQNRVECFVFIEKIITHSAYFVACYDEARNVIPSSNDICIYTYINIRINIWICMYLYLWRLSLHRNGPTSGCKPFGRGKRFSVRCFLLSSPLPLPPPSSSSSTS